LLKKQTKLDARRDGYSQAAKWAAQRV